MKAIIDETSKSDTKVFIGKMQEVQRKVDRVSCKYRSKNDRNLCDPKRVTFMEFKQPSQMCDF